MSRQTHKFMPEIIDQELKLKYLRYLCSSQNIKPNIRTATQEKIEELLRSEGYIDLKRRISERV